MGRVPFLTPQEAPAVLMLTLQTAANTPLQVPVAAGVIRINRRGAPAPDATGVYRVPDAVIGAPSSSAVLQHWEIEDDATAHMIGGFSHDLLRRLLAHPPGTVVPDGRGLWVRIAEEDLRRWASSQALVNGRNQRVAGPGTRSAFRR